MEHHKVNCRQCTEYATCPPRTRIYVNYCGGSRRFFERRIREAVEDCRTHRGRLFKREAHQARETLLPTEAFGLSAPA